MFMWIKANDVNDTWDMIMKRALDKNVMLVPGKAFMVDQVNTYFIFTYFERQRLHYDLAFYYLNSKMENLF